MQVYDKVLTSNYNANTNDKNIGTQYQPAIYNKPITTNSAPITLKPLSDVEGLQRAYARTSGVYIRNRTMLVAGPKDFPQDHWDDLTKIPTTTVYTTLRCINADKALKNRFIISRPYNNVIGRPFVSWFRRLRIAKTISR